MEVKSRTHPAMSRSFDRVLFSYFDPVAGFAGAVDGAVAGEPAPAPCAEEKGKTSLEPSLRCL